MKLWVITACLLLLATVVAKATGLSFGALLTTLGIGLMTLLCLVPVVLVSEMISCRSENPRPHENGPAL